LWVRACRHAECLTLSNAHYLSGAVPDVVLRVPLMIGVFSPPMCTGTIMIIILNVLRAKARLPVPVPVPVPVQWAQAPSGGWNHTPPNFMRNRVIAFGALGVSIIAVFNVSSNREVRTGTSESAQTLKTDDGRCACV
jgi:hypothetical protein